MKLVSFLVVTIAMTLATGAHGQFFLLDFEDLPEGTEISDEFAADFGVTFSIGGSDTLLPIIAVEGVPQVAFAGSGADRPMSSLSGGLTDPIIGGDTNVPNDIVMDFDPPVTSVRLFAIDLDGNDRITVRAFDGAVEVATDTKQAGDPGTGNGRSTEFSVAAASITRIVVDLETPAPFGWAMDFLTFTRPCEGAGCGVQIQVAQESAPGAGDFDDNILGFVRPFAFSGSAADFYAYNVPEGDSWNGPALTPEPDRSHLLFASSPVDDLSMFVVHDRAVPNDPDGGKAEISYELFDDPDGATRTVEDDPPSATDVYTGDPGDQLFTARHRWEPCCTDGEAYSGLACRSTTVMQFTDVDENPNTLAIDGLTEWFVYSATSEPLELALEEDRRVRLVVFPDPGCPADLNCNGAVDFGDILVLLAAWGPCGSCPEDIDQDGAVTFADLLVILAAWGPCGV